MLSYSRIGTSHVNEIRLDMSVPEETFIRLAKKKEKKISVQPSALWGYLGQKLSIIPFAKVVARYLP